MRRVLIVLSALSLGAALLPPLASAQTVEGPTRKSGYWRMDVHTAIPGRPNTVSILLCTDPAVDRTTSPLGVNTTASACPTREVSRSGDHWTIKAVCTVGGMQVATLGTASGDFSTRYHVDVVTRMTPPPTPGLAELKTTIDGAYLGPCPAGKKPGDMQMTMNSNTLGKAPGAPHP